MTPSTWIDFRVRPVADKERTILSDDASPYLRVYGDEFLGRVGLDDLAAELEAQQIRAVVQAEYELGDPAEVNRQVSEMLEMRPDLLLAGIATADPRDPSALSVLQRAHDVHGLRGWIFQPGFLQIYPTDPRCMPLLAYCESANHPVTIHTGINFSRRGSIDFGRPLWVDQVACLFPELTIVCNHGGWPWVTEMLAVLWKHEHVYAEFGGIAPKYMVGASGGWEPITHWMERMVTRQVLLASDWPMVRHERLREEVPVLGLSEEATSAYCHDNAVGLLRKHWPDLDLDVLENNHVETSEVAAKERRSLSGVEDPSGE